MKHTITAMALALSASAVFAEDKVTIEFAYPYSHLFDVTYEAMMPEAVDAAARAALSTDDLIYVVVGDAAVVKPQLDGLGLPVETVSPAN